MSSCIAFVIIKLRNGTNNINNAMNIMVILFIVSILMSNVMNGYLAGIVNSTKILFPMFVGYFMVSCAVTDMRNYEKISLVLIACTLYVAAEGICQYKTGYTIGGLQPIVINKIISDSDVMQKIRIKWYGVFNDPNDLCLLFVPVLPLLVNRLYQKKYILSLISIPVIIGAIYCTQSRGGVLAAAVSVAAYFFLRKPSKMSILVGIALAAILFVLGPNKLDDISASEDSAYGRVEAWYEGFGMFKANPLFGVGQGQFTEHHSLTAHNTYVLILSELGFLGLFSFTGILYFYFKWLYEIYRYKSTYLINENNYIAAISSSVIGLLCVSFFLSRAYNAIPYIYLSLAGFVQTHINSNQRISIQYIDIKNIFIFSVAQVIVLNIIVKALL